MKLSKVVISSDAPAVRDALWAKPVEGGFVLYGLDGGIWKPFKVVDDKETPSPIDDAVVKAEKAIQEVKVNNSKLTPTTAKAVNIKIETGVNKGLKVNGTDVAVKGLVGTGAFEGVPAEPAVGDQYFCTDKQTTEGSANGIVIFYNGTNWVDALGRTIS